VRATLDATLKAHVPYLAPDPKERAFQYLLQTCWELSGLQADGKTLRFVWELRATIAPRRAHEEFKPLRPLQFPKREKAEFALERLSQRHVLILVTIEQARPRGAYDPKKGISFSTYSRRILSRRLWDWYRSDPEFGDTRYRINRGQEESLEALASRGRDDADPDASYLDRRGPGSRLEVIDELHPYAYQESIEEVLCDAAVGR
jgi:hypothetical protein